ncbi:hypothetical protein HYH02_010637 [Chlamydomonas schloesseri]|uniref:Ubiquitin-like protease family profile domain-containing protein n=1 Tax=Chlamydomonas schloesseri TaxID=2026947 RepID=A0A835TL80_9CHLO|nr:hypothetical protein HYH02_010637 [Chlamydomonas schloesseri]|eukprot:KAG2439760.1 hypothetical protein HYH02_010637 [Chlamydomonas schloesseri]
MYDVYLLRPGMFISDMSVRSAGYIIAKEFPDAVVCDPYFMTALRKKPDIIMTAWRHSKKAQDPVILSMYRYVCVPINDQNMHWRGAVLDTKTRTIYWYESLEPEVQMVTRKRGQRLGGAASALSENALEELGLLRQWAQARMEGALWSLEDGQSPRQVDGNSCGIFMLMNFWNRCSSKAVEFGQDDIDMWRYKWMAACYIGKMAV